jgi:hypothetical protein
MIEKAGSYPVYFPPEHVALSQKVLMSLTYEQTLEIANVFYFVNKQANKLFSGLKLDERQRVLHKAIHNSAINCCLSLEEAARAEKEGGIK